ncbi:primary-amine oxidase [Purpureocillium lavendulum]|uniref:Amine oxidase n=1 Tax=Purpureocillium lavendulum TaxID=1247861 RepID=A0AB34G5V6_9HYPO|nr:primary-amine oxidase [Purpureocillium lavendulum]
MATLGEQDGLELRSMGSAAGKQPLHVAAEVGPVQRKNGIVVQGAHEDGLGEESDSDYTANDRRDMQRMGKKQEFRRNFRILSTIGFTICVTGTWIILLTSNTQGLIAGGPAGLFWSLVWSHIGQFFIVLSLAEMASMAPTAGGQYHWVSEFAPRQHQKILSYLSGWLSTVSWQSIVALDAFLIGSIIQGMIALNDASYLPTRWQGTLLVFASVIGVSMFNVFAAKHLPLAEGTFVTLYIFSFFPVIITLLVLAPKQPASAIFTQFTDNGAGWPNIALTVMVGQVSSMFVVLANESSSGSDSVAHMAEEIKDAGIVVPRSMVWSFLLNVPFTFALLLTYLFCIGDVSEALGHRTGFPFMYVFEKATGNIGGATGLTVVVLVLLTMITISSLASTSRQTFAFARDNGLPFSNWLGAVHPTWHVPVNSVIFTCGFSMAFALINIGSTVAFNAMLSLSTVALMATYLVSVGLGRYGLPVNILAMVYACWSFFWSFWPNSFKVTAETFNWACVIFVGLMALASVLYFLQAKYVYDGPVVKPHPLAQLSKEEFCAARDVVVKAHDATESLFFRSIYLQEPPKADLVPFLEAEHAGALTNATERPPRQALVDYDIVKPDKHQNARAVVDLGTAKIVSNRITADGAYPYFTIAEFAKCEETILNSELFKDAMKEFSLPDGFTVTVDPWPYGSDVDSQPRYMQGLVFAKDTSKKDPDANHYAYPIPIIPVIDWVTLKVIRIDRLATGGAGDGIEPEPRTDEPKKLFHNSLAAEYVPELLDQPMRKDLKPLNVVQPEGASFSVQSDGLVEWQKWRFRVGFTPREGAVLHDVCYENRPVMYRLSFSELTVPYGDPRPPFHRKQAFDFGDGGCGRAANSLELGCDCLGAIHYLSSYLASPDGSPTEAKSVVCLHEQDNGILFKHTNFRTSRAVVTRSRELVCQFIVTLANYEYVFAFKLDLAGGITLETRATGVVSVVGIEEGKKSEFGTIVSPGVLAQNHQHIFAARVDPAIDSYREGDTQVVIEESHGVKTDPKTNPFGNLYEVRRSTVERPTWIDAEPKVNRVLRLENPNKQNEMSGKNVGYKLLAPATQMMMAGDDTIMAKRAPFAKHNFWVTGYRDGELWAAGEFTNQSRMEKGGVGEMVKRGDWFTGDGPTSNGNAHANVYGFTHNPRVEDWPVMPTEAYQIHLRPADFFVRNPALDVPSTRNQSSVLVPCCGDKPSQEMPQTVQGSQKGPVPQDEESAPGATEKTERRLSKVLTGLFKSKAKDAESKE